MTGNTTTWLYQIHLPNSPVTLEVDNGTVVRATPSFAQWGVGKPVGAVLNHYVAYHATPYVGPFASAGSSPP